MVILMMIDNGNNPNDERSVSVVIFLTVSFTDYKCNTNTSLSP